MTHHDANNPHQLRPLCKSLICFILHGSEKIKIRAMLDSCAEVNLVSKNLCDQNNIQGTKQTLAISVSGGQTLRYKNQRSVFLRLQSVDGHFTSHTFIALTTPLVSQKIDPILITPENYSNFKNLPWTERYPHDHKSDLEVSLLIGEPLYSDLIVGSPIKADNSSEPLYCQQTKLGFSLCGATTLVHNNDPRILTVTHSHECIPNLDRFFDLEHIGIRPEEEENELTLMEMRSYERIRKVTRYIPELKRWETGLLWKDPENKISENNRQTALACMNRVSKSLQKDPEKLSMMNAGVQKFHDDGHAEFVKHHELSKEKCFYMSIHPVFAPGRNTKCRIVMDCAQKTAVGSINDHLLEGSNLLPCLVQTIIRFRKFAYSMVTDISSMYVRILLNKADSDYCRFLWADGQVATKDSKLDFAKITRRLTSLGYGFVHAPFTANYIVKENTKRFRHKPNYKRSCDAIDHCMYMDDLCCSFPTRESGKLCVEQIYEMFDSSGFPLHKFLSSCPEILTPVPPESRSQNHTTKVLGLYYQSIPDLIIFPYFPDDAEIFTSTTITKRKALSQQASLYDPCGLISPIILRSKLLMQAAWQEKVPWDSCLPEPLARKFLEWQKQLPLLKNLKMPRCLIPEGYTAKHLLSFGDASKDAYAACNHLVSSRKNADGTESLYSILVFSKSRVAPIKSKLSIVRLECLAALLCVRTSKYVLDALQLDIPQYFFSDSQVTLFRINKDCQGYRLWLGRRLEEIQKYSTPDRWIYVKSSENPADLCSRGVDVEDLLTSTLWMQGPPFARDPNHVFESEKFRPNEQKFRELEAEDVKKIIPAVRMTKFLKSEFFDPKLMENILQRFEHWRSACRILAYVQKYVQKLLTRARKNLNMRRTRSNVNANKLVIRRIDKENLPIVSKDEFLKAELTFFRFAQFEKFPKEILHLQVNNSIVDFSKLSALKRFMPMWSASDRLLKMTSRLRYSDLIGMDANPIILPKMHMVTTKYILHCHKTLGHANLETTLYASRQRVWTEAGRRECKRILFACTCRPLVSLENSISMSALPKDRIEYTYPFGRTFVDFLGHFLVRGHGYNGKRSGSPLKKVWVILYSCYYSRAIFVEPLYDCTTDAVIHSLRRLAATYSAPFEIMSDNARQFHKAGSDLRKILRSYDWNRIQHALDDQGRRPTWRFNVELMPWANPAEPCVGIFKAALRTALGSACVSFEEFHTLCKEASSIVNCRPLTVVNPSTEESTPVTPAKLLLGRDAAMAVLPEVTKRQDVDLAERFRSRNVVMNAFWKKFSKTYLISLATTKRWYSDLSVNLRENQMVLIRDPSLKKYEWKYGVITKLNKSKDGKVRSCELRTSSGTTLTRPTQRLSVFENDLPRPT